jgi:D-alanyl-D-alanine carboxypeptidase
MLIDGIKTGFVCASGYNIVVSVRKGTDRLIVAVLGGKTAKKRNAQVLWLASCGFNKLSRKRYMTYAKASKHSLSDILRKTSGTISAKQRSLHKLSEAGREKKISAKKISEKSATAPATEAVDLKKNVLPKKSESKPKNVNARAMLRELTRAKQTSVVSALSSTFPGGFAKKELKGKFGLFKSEQSRKNYQKRNG